MSFKILAKEDKKSHPLIIRIIMVLLGSALELSLRVFLACLVLFFVFFWSAFQGQSYSRHGLIIKIIKSVSCARDFTYTSISA